MENLAFVSTGGLQMVLDGLSASLGSEENLLSVQEVVTHFM